MTQLKPMPAYLERICDGIGWLLGIAFLAGIIGAVAGIVYWLDVGSRV